MKLNSVAIYTLCNSTDFSRSRARVDFVLGYLHIVNGTHGVGVCLQVYRMGVAMKMQLYWEVRTHHV